MREWPQAIRAPSARVGHQALSLASQATSGPRSRTRLCTPRWRVGLGSPAAIFQRLWIASRADELTYCTNHGDRRLGRFREAAGPLAVVFQAAPQIVMTNAGSRSKTLPRCRKNCAQTRRIRQDQPLQLPFIVNRQYDSHGLAAARDDHRAALRGPEVGAETSLDVGHRSDFRSGISSLPMRRHQPRALSNCLTHIELAGILACPWMVLRARRDAGNSVAAPDSAYHSLLAGPLSAKSASPQR